MKYAKKIFKWILVFLAIYYVICNILAIMIVWIDEKEMKKQIRAVEKACKNRQDISNRNKNRLSFLNI